MTALYLFFCFIIPIENIIEEHVNIIEINHIYNEENGWPSSDFINFWRISNKEEWLYLDCVGWRNIPTNAKREPTKDETSEIKKVYKKIGVLPPDNIKIWNGLNIYFDHSKKLYVYIFFDGLYLRRVTANSYSRVWTLYDRETNHRKYQELNERTNLRKPLVQHVR